MSSPCRVERAQVTRELQDGDVVFGMKVNQFNLIDFDMDPSHEGDSIRFLLILLMS